MTATSTEKSSSRPSSGRGWFVIRFLREMVSELRKVIWPSRKELITYTIVVIVFVVIMVSLVAGLDIAFTKLVVWLFG
ncbi:preprotein translocase subunit SecE [Jatrophihabitans sp. GAS493]|uniref:preprotein translocase subunit SecE n=1 Tax=Jatrophihabitans sp. GAS493 TaxID=1907575 RepID=UPI001F52FE7E|nr:preprotein translocase subunit SecE [Jatrophihabitans sp. GAS493]